MRQVPMWKVNDQLYHYSDFERAASQGKPEAVTATLPNDYFIGTVQHENVAISIEGGHN